jgi:hypothetical protein
MEISRARLLVPFLSVGDLNGHQFCMLTEIAATADGRGLVAIGCAEGVWIGFRHDSRCMCSSLSITLHSHPMGPFSDATGATSPDGDPMRHVGGFWYLPCTRRQGRDDYFLPFA